MRLSKWSFAGAVMRALNAKKGLAGGSSANNMPGFASRFRHGGHSPTGQGTPQHSNIYDAKAQYADAGSQYQTPAAWFEDAPGAMPTQVPTPGDAFVPHTQFDEPDELPQTILQQNQLLTLEMIKELVADTTASLYGIDPDRIDNDAMYEASIMSMDMLDHAMEEANAPEMAQLGYDQQMEQPEDIEAVDATEANTGYESTMPGPDGMANDLYDIVEGEMEQPMAGSLEAIVEEMMPGQMEPEMEYDEAMEDPEMMDEPMPNEQMQQMMNPFMMPGPFGPPGPGPGGP